MKSQKFRAVLLCLLLSLLSACGDTSPSQTPIAPVDIHFQSQATDLVSVTGSDSGIYAAAEGSCMRRYNLEGDLQEEYPGTEDITHLYYSDGLVYGYQPANKDIVAFDPQSKELSVLCFGLDVSNIRSLTVSGGSVFLIAIPLLDYSNPDLFTPREDGFLDFSEKILSVDIQSGQISELNGISQPLALYRSSNNILYVYAHSKKGYDLYTYDTEKKKAAKTADMSELGYLTAFAYENDFFVYASAGTVSVKKMPDGIIYVGADFFPLTSTGSFSYLNGNILLLEQHEQESDDTGTALFSTTLRVLRLETDFTVLLGTESASPAPSNPGNSQTPSTSGNIVISADLLNSKMMDLDLVKKLGGPGAVYYQVPSSWDAYQAFLASILAGDENIDIYILLLHIDTTRALRDMGAYVSLKDSNPIQDYINQCFDWVGDTSRTSDGDTWMLPLNFDMPALWYVPENFEKFGLTPDDAATYDSYMQTLEYLNRNKGDYTTFAVYPQTYEWYWHTQYEEVYNDYQNKKVDFRTEVYYHFFESFWSGFHRYGNPLDTQSYQPQMQFDQLTFLNDGTSVLDSNRVVFSMDMIDGRLESIHSNPDSWRILPMPRLTEDVKYNYMTGTVAIINPYSKRKEQAVAFLETVAANMLEVMPKSTFLQKDLSAGDGFYDMSLPVNQDLYNIYKNGAAICDIYPIKDSRPYIDDFQDGKITHQEAVAEIQRQAEIWLNE